MVSDKQRTDVYISLTNRYCPVCNSNNAAQIYSNSDYKLIDTYNNYYHTPIYYVICNFCALIYLNPAPDKEEYKQRYSKTMITPSASLEENYERGELHFKVFIEVMDEYFKQVISKISVFEIGCGNGYLLNKLNEQYGPKITSIKGIEPSINLCKAANDIFGVDVKNKFLDDIDGDKEYDLIIMDNVFEHFDFPLIDLLRVKTMLKEDGIIYIAVPNLFLSTSGIRNIFAGHPCNYVIENLMLIMDKAGLWISDYYYKSTWLIALVRLKSKKDKLPNIKFEKVRDEVTRKFRDFISKNDSLVEKIKSLLIKEIDNLAANGRKLIIFGAGEHTLELFSIIDFKDTVIGLIDNNEIYQGVVRMGCSVYAPKDILSLTFDKILLSSNAFEREMKQQLIDMGIREEQIITLYETTNILTIGP